MTRTFYDKMAIVGTSGTGKSYVIKTADKEATGIINAEKQPFPFKLDGQFKYEGRPKTWASFMKNLKDYAENKDIRNIIIDSQTMALDMLIRESSLNFKGFDIYKHYNKCVYEYLDYLKSIQKDVIVTSHSETAIIEGYKQKCMASHGKEFGDGKIERHFVTVLYSGKSISQGKPEFYLKTFEEDSTSKSPEGLFKGPSGEDLIKIPNSAKFIFDSMEKYYSI